MKIKLTFLMLALFASILTACGTNGQEQQQNVDFQPTQYDPENQNGITEDMVPDYDKEEPDLGEEPSEDRNKRFHQH